MYYSRHAYRGAGCASGEGSIDERSRRSSFHLQFWLELRQSILHPWEASNSHIERVSVPSMRPAPIMLCASHYLPVPATTTTRLRNAVSSPFQPHCNLILAKFGTLRWTYSSYMRVSDVHFRVSSLIIQLWWSGNRLRKKNISNWHHHQRTDEEIWARSGGCPDPLLALENVCVVAKQLKRGTLIGPSDSAKNPSNRAPSALLFGLLRFSSFEAVQKVAPTAQ